MRQCWACTTRKHKRAQFLCPTSGNIQHAAFRILPMGNIGDNTTAYGFVLVENGDEKRSGQHFFRRGSVAPFELNSPGCCGKTCKKRRKYL